MISTVRRSCIALSCVVGAAFGSPAHAEPASYEIAKGPFAPTWESLANYECPEWFRDAKFGIWAHYGPQCEPEQGDWYARNMYLPHEPRYFDYHRKTYGHQSQFGFKDICHQWKSARFDAERLMELYQRAGAKYFVAMANHHCNFDLWDSRHQPWNSVNIGPKRDFMTEWSQAARKRGLRFGVTVHNARSWDWYEPAHQSDPSGPLAGLPYDGALTKEQGRGQWWEGYDPADLYGPHGAARTAAARQAYIDRWFARTKDLLDQHRPDLLYFDDVNLPLGAAGMHIGAHFYNANLHWNDGQSTAVLNSKRAPAGFRRAIVLDLERGTRNALDPLPWQTDTCIGNWHYKRNIDWYQNPTQILQMLVDVVSKNGNLLLSIPIRGDGTLDDREEKILAALADWMAVNEAAIFATRPWSVYGEGPLADAAGRIYDQQSGAAPAPRVRFTTKGETLYAILFDWPADQKLRIRSLAASNAGDRGEIRGVKLLGHAGPLDWRRTSEGLELALPKSKPCEHAYVFEIDGRGLTPAPLLSRPIVKAERGAAIELGANLAATHGYSPVWHRKDQQDPIGSICSWGDWEDSVSWQVEAPAAAEYEVEITYGCQTNCKGSQYRVVVGENFVSGQVQGTGTWHDFITEPLGKLPLRAGLNTIRIEPLVGKWTVIELRSLRLKPIVGG